MSLRINKLLSDAGIGSRREVEKYIVAGRVTLNGERAELTDIVVEDDIVTLDGEELPVNDILRGRRGVRSVRPQCRAHQAGQRHAVLGLVGTRPQVLAAR